MRVKAKCRTPCSYRGETEAQEAQGLWPNPRVSLVVVAWWQKPGLAEVALRGHAAKSRWPPEDRTTAKVSRHRPSTLRSPFLTALDGKGLGGHSTGLSPTSHPESEVDGSDAVTLSC